MTKSVVIVLGQDDDRLCWWPSRSLCVLDQTHPPPKVFEHTGTGQAIHRVMLVLFHLVRTHRVRGIFEFYRQFWVQLVSC
jgi:hypothetical protein